MHRKLNEQEVSSGRTQTETCVSPIVLQNLICNLVAKVAVEHLGISYTDFQIPDCPQCLLENHKNAVVSFVQCIYTLTEKLIVARSINLRLSFSVNQLHNHLKKIRKSLSATTIPYLTLRLNIPRYRFIDTSDRLLVVGTTLATYSAFRLISQSPPLHLYPMI